MHYLDGATYRYKQDNEHQWKHVPDKDKIIAVEVLSDITGQSHTLWHQKDKPGLFFAQLAGKTSLGSFMQHTHKRCMQVGSISEFFDAKLAVIITPDPADPRKKVNTPSEILFLKKKCPKCGLALTLPSVRYFGARHDVPLYAEQVGLIKNRRGGCVILEVTAERAVRYKTTLKELGITDSGLKALGINLMDLK